MNPDAIDWTRNTKALTRYSPNNPHNPIPTDATTRWIQKTGSPLSASRQARSVIQLFKPWGSATLLMRSIYDSGLGAFDRGAKPALARVGRVLQTRSRPKALPTSRRLDPATHLVTSVPALAQCWLETAACDQALRRVRACSIDRFNSFSCISASLSLRESCLREMCMGSLGGGRRPARERASSDPTVLHPSGGPLVSIPPLFPRRLQLPIPLGENLLLMLDEHVLRRCLRHARPVRCSADKKWNIPQQEPPSRKRNLPPSDKLGSEPAGADSGRWWSRFRADPDTGQAVIENRQLRCTNLRPANSRNRLCNKLLAKDNRKGQLAG